MNICAREECEITFTPKTHNQRYCSNECCRIATNQRIMRRYYEKRDQRLGKVRICSSCSVTKLSRYNDSQICAVCEAESGADRRRSMISMINAVDWAV